MCIGVRCLPFFCVSAEFRRLLKDLKVWDKPAAGFSKWWPMDISYIGIVLSWKILHITLIRYASKYNNHSIIFISAPSASSYGAAGHFFSASQSLRSFFLQFFVYSAFTIRFQPLRWRRRLLFDIIRAGLMFIFSGLDAIDDSLKQSRNPLSLLGWHFAVADVALGRILIGLLGCYSSFLFQVDFVPNYQHRRIFSLIVVKQVDPIAQIQERLRGSDIVNKHSALRVPQIGRDQTSEFFLAGSVPEQEPVEAATVVEVFGQKVNANGILSMIIKVAVGKSLYYWWLADAHVAQEYYLVLDIADAGAFQVVDHRSR